MSKADIWQQHINPWRDSGLSQVEFCRQHNIKQHNLHYWRKRLTSLADKPNNFVPIVVTRSVPVRLMVGSQCVVELPCESLPDLLLALRTRGLLHASA